MSRWHASSCTTPDISIVDGRKVSCHSCATSCPPVEVLVARSSTAQLSIPADQLLGHLNLKWPPSVPYAYRQGSRENDTHELCPRTRDEAKSRDTGEASFDLTDPSGHPDSHVYHKLGTREFRLICLPAAEDRDSLIQLKLETFSFDDCPEYEPTSYAWAGEDGDSNPCCPIYVGEYYDVLLQTKNCHSMLQYLRPHRGDRMVWVDAICINQQDFHEREAQIAQMRTI
ncbi:hypothetical protein F5B20DRAFT_591239 [Whalleya microplaca]|nr:hypothetical protein F5B20DRAFT_591239 [Whalleya microplaca]